MAYLWLNQEREKTMLELGHVYATPRVIETTDPVIIFACLIRHMRGDWGNVCPEDREANNEALKNGSRVLSAYWVSDERKIWIITEADRSATTILYPEEY